VQSGSEATLPIMKAIAWAQTAPHLTARALRYALVGIGNGAVFAGTSVLAVSQLGMHPTAASALGYLCSVPLSFIGHRSFTFRSANAWKGEAARFVLAHACCLTVSVLIMSAVMEMRLPYFWGLVGAVLLIPLANFLIANFWVFTQRWKVD